MFCLAFASSASAELIIGASQLVAPVEVEIDRAITEVNEAAKSFDKRDFDACLKQLSAAVKAHPELPPPHALFAKLAAIGNQYPLIRPALDRAVMEDPEHPEIFVLFGNLALLENRMTDAFVHFEKAKALSAAKRWTPEQRQRFDRLCQQGNATVAESRGDWKAARAALESWLNLQPTNVRARRRLGVTLFNLGQQDLAYKELKKASEDDATLEAPEVMLGWLYSSVRDSKKANEWMDRAVKAAPNSLSVRMAVFSWLLEQGRGDDAQTQAEAAAKLDPKSEQAALQVKLMLGMAARERKDFVRAESIFQNLVVDSPANASARNQLALVLAEQSDEAKRKRALELAELSVRQDSNSADALHTLGVVFYRLKRLEDAEKVLQAVMKSGKGNSDTAYFLALSKSKRGQPEAAAPLLKTALAAPGLFLFRKDAQEWLERLQKSEAENGKSSDE